MKGAGILWGFVPLVAYAVLSGGSPGQTELALLAALIAAVAAGWHDFRKGRIMAWANLAIFGLPLAALGLLSQAWIISWMNVFVFAGLATVAFGSLLARRPFTLPYAREMVPPEVQAHPGFLAVNRLMTGVWGAVFAAGLALSAVSAAGPPGDRGVLQVLTYAVLAAGIAFTLWYPSHVRKTRGGGATREEGGAG